MPEQPLPHLLTITLVEERPMSWSADWILRPGDDASARLHGRITDILAMNAHEARLMAIPRCLRAMDQMLALETLC